MHRRIGLLALPGFQLLDISGPLDVFAQANIEMGRTVYDLCVVACEPGPVRSSSGACLLPHEIVGSTKRFDTLLVAGAPDAAARTWTPALLAWMVDATQQSRRFGSVCTGAFVLAAAGLLKGRRVTTHWAGAERLKSSCPQAIIVEDALHVRDGKLRTAAGVTAGLDLALALVEEDHGREVAKRVASHLVMYFRRTGGQLQFSRKAEAGPAGRSALQETQRWVAANPALSHNVQSLAEHAGMSSRHFARLFQAEVRVTPAAWVESVRIEAARGLLESGHAPKQVAAACGFANADTLRRCFIKRVGVSPAEFRRAYS